MNEEDVYTKIKKREDLPKSNFPSPTLIFQKWHRYKSFIHLEKTKSPKKFIDHISNCVQKVNADKNFYRDWCEDYKKTLDSVQGTVSFLNFKTVWRLIVGWGTNPALETGIQLHHLYGFPYIPGSAVKGVLHHVAELSLIDSDWRMPGKDEEATAEKIKALEKAVGDAELVRIVFGSLFIKKHTMEINNDNKKEEYGFETPLKWFENWKNNWDAYLGIKKENSQTLLERIKKLASEEHTGGMITCFDAVPAEEEFNKQNILQADILNCHYSKYYGGENHPPSDDQDPNPVTFLTVKPETTYIFPIRLQTIPDSEGRDDEEKERIRILKDFGKNRLMELVKSWLEKGLSEWGIGSKTAAGYGYFLPVENEEKKTKE
ncbi:MAG: type III-B CRISPR module RAMP protein Cmr6 [Candidatus Aminicenantes bacterium]|nr:type III-B CRISPR module RAMP protein Cmr6 [Candidatus Aminicenantes bacterium]